MGSNDSKHNAEEEAMLTMDEAGDKFDFIRFIWSDIHGIARERMVPGRHAKTALAKGKGVFHGIQVVSPRSQLLMLDDAIDWHGNCTMKADLETMRPVPWASDPDSRVTVGLVLCDKEESLEGDSLPICPRSLARRLKNQLFQEFSLLLMNGVEHEFVLLHRDTLKPVYDEADFLTSLLFSKFRKFFMRVDKNLHQVGVDIESMQTGNHEGRFELVTKARFAMESIDQSFLLKAGVKELSMQEGYMATFMTQPFVGSDEARCCGAHINFSLWNAEGECASGADKISKTFSHLLAGLIEHAPAMTSLCCPTVNCYRRLHQPWAPHDASWGVEDRSAMLRIRSGVYGSFAENRLPSAAANPYLVVAAMIAAGMDGLRRKLELSPAQSKDATVLPRNLQEGLHALENDEVMVKALGEKFVELFCSAKRTHEIEKLPEVELDPPSDAAMKAEQHMYLEYI